MAGSIRLRRYDPDDADAVWAVHEAALRASALSFVEDAAVDEDITAIEDTYLGAGGEFLVGDRGAAGPDDTDTPASEIVAIGGYRPVDERTVEIRRMRVNPEHQRRGYATALLAELETRATADGYGTAELETIEPLRAARAFYEDAGYETVETWEDEVTGVQRYRYRKRL